MVSVACDLMGLSPASDHSVWLFVSPIDFTVGLQKRLLSSYITYFLFQEDELVLSHREAQWCSI